LGFYLTWATGSSRAPVSSLYLELLGLVARPGFRLGGVLGRPVIGGLPNSNLALEAGRLKLLESS
jgi:hypothetical protein